MKIPDRDFVRRFLLVMTGIIGLGISMSFLIEVNYGTDTSTFVNLAISDKMGITFGICMIFVNLVLFIPQLIYGRKLIHIGTVLNMFLIGNISDFCRHLWSLYLPQELFVLQPYRTIVFVLALIPFLVSIALYMNADLGQVPFDAAPTLISRSFHLPYIVVRILWDFTAIIIGILAGRALTIGTVIMAVSIGPTVSFVGRLMKRNPQTA